MTFKVSVMAGGKIGKHLTALTEIIADAYAVEVDGGVQFVNVKEKFFGGEKLSLVASLPPGDWIIERV